MFSVGPPSLDDVCGTVENSHRADTVLALVQDQPGTVYVLKARYLVNEKEMRGRRFSVPLELWELLRMSGQLGRNDTVFLFLGNSFLKGAYFDAVSVGGGPGRV